MKETFVRLGFVTVVSALVMTACLPSPTATPTTYIPTPTPEDIVGLANPASVYCEEQGYVLEMRTDENGTYGVCIFPDGSECEEWAYFRGECAPGEQPPTELPPDATAPDVSYEGVSFSYDDSLATGVTAEIVQAVGPEGVGIWDVAPEHIRFSFEGYVVPDSIHEPRVLVFPVADYEAVNQGAAMNIASLRQLLSERPASPDNMPFLPPPGGPVPVRTQFAYLDFQSGTGLRSVVWTGQVQAVSNRELVYTFQGLTADGGYYVAIHLPVNHPTLPADGFEIPGGDLEAFAANNENYVLEMTLALDSEDPSSFFPDLALLDALVESLEITRESPAGPPMGGGGQDPYAGWETYTNPEFGFTVRYPGDCSIMGGDLSTSVQFVGPLLGNEHWPWFFVDHFDSEFYHPPSGTNLREWVTEHVPSYDDISETEIANLPAVHLVSNASPQAYGSDDYYFAREGQLYHIQILHAGGQQDWELYSQFLNGFTFTGTP